MEGDSLLPESRAPQHTPAFSRSGVSDSGSTPCDNDEDIPTTQESSASTKRRQHQAPKADGGNVATLRPTPVDGYEVPRSPASSRPSIETQDRDHPLHQPQNTDPEQSKKSEVEVSTGSVDGAHAYWTPIWLQRRTLFALASLFASLAAALVALWIANNAYNGFRPTLTTYHYGWTYGPSAILVCVLALWRQVDYHCKAMQPWQELSRGPAYAEDSMLLDYVSPMHITSFMKAVRKRHTQVAASVAGFGILKVVILLSTGLLILTPTQFSRPRIVTIDTAFDTGAFWNTIPDDDYLMPARTDPQFLGPYPNISADSVYSFVQTLKGQSMAVPGVAENTVHASFSGPTTANMISLSAEVDVFAPEITCEVAQPTIRVERSGLTPRLTTATCSVGSEHQNRLDLHDVSNGSCQKNCTHWLALDMWRVNCSEIDNTSSIHPLDVDTPYDFRFAFMVSSV